MWNDTKKTERQTFFAAETLLVVTAVDGTLLDGGAERRGQAGAGGAGQRGAGRAAAAADQALWSGHGQHAGARPVAAVLAAGRSPDSALLAGAQALQQRENVLGEHLARALQWNTKRKENETIESQKKRSETDLEDGGAVAPVAFAAEDVFGDVQIEVEDAAQVLRLAASQAQLLVVALDRLALGGQAFGLDGRDLLDRHGLRERTVPRQTAGGNPDEQFRSFSTALQSQ